MVATILIAEDNRGVRNVLKEKLEYENFAVCACDSLDAAIEEFNRNPYDVVIMSEKLFQEYKTIRDRVPKGVFMIIVTDKPTIETAVEAMRLGVFDFIVKPLDMNTLLGSIKRASVEMDERYQGLRKQVTKRRKSTATDLIVGESVRMKHLKKLIEKVAPSDARVLITGPNGTGKELVAKALHQQSLRNEAPFVEVNCAAIPSELIESELFGHEKGAFTSAIKQRKGKFEQANGGTLFLDEIGDMSLSAQAKVLRALQENRISRVGSDKDIHVDVRILAATNKDLREEINEGRFREDLYHRLSVILIPVPPLSDRKEDIPLLVDYFLSIICEEYGMPVKKIEPRGVSKLQELGWTGNIRELRNVVERLVILSGDTIMLEDIEMYASSVVAPVSSTRARSVKM